MNFIGTTVMIVIRHVDLREKNLQKACIEIGNQHSYRGIYCSLRAVNKTKFRFPP